MELTTMPENAYRGAMPDDKDRGRAFAKLIRDARANSRLTQDAVVTQSGISKSTLIRWEGGRAERPEPDQVRALCKTLNIDPREAAVALGYLQREDLGQSAQPEHRVDPSVAEVIEILQDPAVSDEDKTSWVRYLKFLREQARGTGNRRRAAG